MVPFQDGAIEIPRNARCALAEPGLCPKSGMLRYALPNTTSDAVCVGPQDAPARAVTDRMPCHVTFLGPQEGRCLVQLPGQIWTDRGRAVFKIGPRLAPKRKTLGQLFCNFSESRGKNLTSAGMES